MAELVDAIDSKSIDGNIMRVRFSLWAQNYNLKKYVRIDKCQTYIQTQFFGLIPIK